MARKTKVFSNPFSKKKIIHTRLLNFAKDVSARLNKSSTNDEYKNIVSQLKSGIKILEKDLQNLDISSVIKQGKVLTCNQLIKSFKKTMREKEAVIAHFLGGRESMGYTAFYPSGITEYISINRAKLPRLLDRINNETATYAAAMDETLRNALTGFADSWHEASTNLSVIKSDISEGKNKLVDDRIILENILYDAVHTICKKFNGDELKCAAFFDFSLLYPKTRTRKKPKSNIELPAAVNP